jgi:hypothetical protein
MGTSTTSMKASDRRWFLKNGIGALTVSGAFLGGAAHQSFEGK